MKDYTSKKIKALNGSPTVVLNDLVKKLKSEGQDVVNLAGGEPDFNTPSKITEEAIKSMKNGFTSYVPSQGIQVLREKIANKLFKENNIIIDSEKGLIVTASAKSALHISLFTFLEDGDEVLLFDPSWVSYKPLINITGAKPVIVSLDYNDNFKITEEKLLKYISPKTKAILLCSPNNPTGRVFSKEELNILVRLIKKHDLLAISDEIYEKIIYDENKHISLGSFKEISDRVLTINGFSKAYAMCGWRLGYVAAAPDLIKEMLKVQQHIITCANSFVQEGAVKAFECVDELNYMRNEYQKRRNYIVSELNKIPCITCNYPEGAFYVFPHIDYKNMDSFELSHFILSNTNVAVTAGDSFGKGGEKCVRMSFATSMGNLEKAMNKIKKIFI